MIQDSPTRQDRPTTPPLRPYLAHSLSPPPSRFSHAPRRTSPSPASHTPPPRLRYRAEHDNAFTDIPPSSPLTTGAAAHDSRTSATPPSGQHSGRNTYYSTNSRSSRGRYTSGPILHPPYSVLPCTPSLQEASEVTTLISTGSLGDSCLL